MSERAFEASTTGEKNSQVFYDLARASSGVENRREAARVYEAAKSTPGLTESGIAPDVLAGLLPDEEIIELPRVRQVSGSLGYRFVKRAFDLCSCSVTLVIMAIPMAIIAIKIKGESEGPIIYAQRRVGLNGRVFNLYKFRSMYQNAEVRGAQWAKDEDPRVTPFGKFLRNKRMAPVIIGTPGDGEPTKSLSHPVNSSLDLHKCERRPEPFLVAQTHYTSSVFLSFAVFEGLGAARDRSLCACGATPFIDFRAVA